MKIFTCLILCFLYSLSLYGQVSKNVIQLDYMDEDDIQDQNTVRGTDVWGYTDASTGKEYALMGKAEDGLVIINVTDPTDIELVTNPFISGNNTVDIKIYGEYAYIAHNDDDKIKIVDLDDPDDPSHDGIFY